MSLENMGLLMNAVSRTKPGTEEVLSTHPPLAVLTSFCNQPGKLTGAGCFQVFPLCYYR